MAYCPNCSQPLESTKVLICPHCDARVGPGSSWTPLATHPSGRSSGGHWGCLVPVLALAIWFGIGVVAIASVIPYGGSSGWWEVWGVFTGILILASGVWFVGKVVAFFRK